MLAAIYVIVFAIQIFLLARACRGRGGFGVVLGLNLISTAAACFLAWYFDTLPGIGIMPGFAYFPEVMYSLLAVCCGAILTLVTFFCRLLHRKR